jgi:predicted small integral membrane protein
VTGRTVVAVLTGITGLQMALITFGNITDFGTNQAFVVHVLAMDTTFTSPNTMWRAITSTGVADAAYLLIIAWELISAVVLIAGFVVWLRGRSDRVARQLSIVGWLMWVLLFGGGFIVIGGEWFEMWEVSNLGERKTGSDLHRKGFQSVCRSCVFRLCSVGYRSRAKETVVDRLTCAVERVWQQVAVDLQRESRIGVAQNVRQFANVRSGGQLRGRVEMPQLMPS